MDVIAHRGFAAIGAENTLPTLRRAGEIADAVEFDVRLARDGEPVVFHDRRVDRLTDATGPLDEYTAAELAALTVGDSDATIPALDAVLDALAVPIVVDCKTGGLTDRLRTLLCTYPAPVLVSSFDPDLLAALPADLDVAVLCAPDGFEGELPERALTSVEAAMTVSRELDAAALHPHHSQCSTKTVERAHDLDLRVNAWTVRNRPIARRLQRVGVDGVITDSPDYVGQRGE